MRHANSQDRSACATSIERRVKELANEKGMPPCICVWNLGQGWENSGPHRLDVDIKEGTIKIYFTDSELVAYGQEDDREQIERRLCYLMSELEEEELLLSPVLTVKRLTRGSRP